MTQSGRPLDRTRRDDHACRWVPGSNYSARIRGAARGLPGLKEAGFVEGRDVAIEYRWADDQYDRLPGLAADLVSRKLAVITTIGGSAASLAAKISVDRRPIKSTMGNCPFRARQFRSAALPMPTWKIANPTGGLSVPSGDAQINVC
jgi:hypothetical protein